MNEIEPHYHQNDLIFYVRQRSSDIPIIKEVVRDDNYLTSEFINGGDIVVDIGGHIGSFSVLAGSRGAVVLTYEPVKRNFDLLKKNTEINGFNNTVFNMAVTGKEEVRRIYVRGFNFGGSNLYTVHENPDFYEDVQCTTLDRIFENNNLDHIDFLKLDCEGAEVEILEATTRLKDIKTIALEFHGQETLNKLLRRLGKTHKVNHKVANDVMGTVILTSK